MTAYNTFENIVEQCFDLALKRSTVDDKLIIKSIIENICVFAFENNPKFAKKYDAEIKGFVSRASIMRDYLSVHPLSFKGHARLREMVICMSEYMDYHDYDAPKGETFYKIYKEFVEMVKPDGHSNAENYFREHSDDEQAAIIKDIENQLTIVGSYLRRLYKLSMKLENEYKPYSGEYTISNTKMKIRSMMESEYCHYALGKDVSRDTFLY